MDIELIMVLRSITKIIFTGEEAAEFLRAVKGGGTYLDALKGVGCAKLLEELARTEGEIPTIFVKSGRRLPYWWKDGVEMTPVEKYEFGVRLRPLEEWAIEQIDPSWSDESVKVLFDALMVLTEEEEEEFGELTERVNRKGKSVLQRVRPIKRVVSFFTIHFMIWALKTWSYKHIYMLTDLFWDAKVGFACAFSNRFLFELVNRTLDVDEWTMASTDDCYKELIDIFSDKVEKRMKYLLFRCHGIGKDALCGSLTALDYKRAIEIPTICGISVSLWDDDGVYTRINNYLKYAHDVAMFDLKMERAMGLRLAGGWSKWYGEWMMSA